MNEKNLIPLAWMLLHCVRL